MTNAPTITSKDGNILINDANLHVGRIVTNTISSLPGSSVQAHLDVYYDGDQVGDSLLTLNGVRTNSGDFTVDSNTITFNKTGIYNVDFTMTSSTTPGSWTYTVFLLKNRNSIVPSSALHLSSAYVTCTCSFSLDMNEDDNMSIIIHSSETYIGGACGITITEIFR